MHGITRGPWMMRVNHLACVSTSILIHQLPAKGVAGNDLHGGPNNYAGYDFFPDFFLWKFKLASGEYGLDLAGLYVRVCGCCPARPHSIVSSFMPIPATFYLYTSH
jgi:hypothetical protein